MTKRQIIIIAITLTSVGLIFFAFKQHYIILNFSSHIPMQTHSATSNKKKVLVHYWHNEQWNQEEVSLLLSEHTYNNIYHLISQYLQLLQDESIIKHKTIIQQVLINYDDQEALLSFDRVPWNKEFCTQDTLMIVEGILRTIKANEPRIKKVRFLVNHQPMTDTHLDFSNAWPIDGFLAP